jgi:Mitochondrial small ribosomal subunit Rsm22
MFQKEPRIPLKQIADSVLKLSDFYIQYPEATTPWDEEFCQIAYRHYFLPLNFLRNSRVVQKGFDVGFFADLNSFTDWGCGPGTASFAFSAHEGLRPQIKKQILIDQSELALSHFDDLHSQLINVEKAAGTSLRKALTFTTPKENSCLVFSYSLTEVSQFPEGWEQFEALMILEPSTSEDGRHLLELRQKLIDKGYSIWAPCTHQLKCPLLVESKTDWCHDRIQVDAPDWFLELEDYLPMRNRTVTTSYLLARRKTATSYPNTVGRLIGDSREEKGKTRQMFCRREKREFLTWMHKKIAPQIFPRGELVELPTQFEEKANELRVESECRRV